MKVLIIEDESINASRLQRLLKEIEPACRILGILDTVEGSVQWLKSNEMPDLITMDIRLADGLSFTIFEQAEITCPVIFTTAYDEYALRAFKVNSIDYLMKPIEKSELAAALHKYKAMPRHAESAKLAVLLKDLITRPDYRQRFLVSHRDGYKSVNVADIDFIFTEFKVSHLFLSDLTVVQVPQTMEELENELDPAVFFRANRQFFIRAESIRSISNYFNSKLKIELKNQPDHEIIISREKASQFKSWMDR